ncbi:MAG: NUDIX hydrolase [Nitrospinae bacterium]|nr:NUDIX hydrolase [Nitrospinota bacterium]
MTLKKNGEDRRLREAACDGLGKPELVHENPWFRVCNRGGYFTTEPVQRGLAVLPVVEGRGIVLIRSRRPVVNDTPLEIPAGGIGDDEEPRAGASRELAEETGVRIGDLSRFEMLPPLSHSTNRNPMLFYVYKVVITAGEFENRGPHDHEVESVHLYSFDEIRKMIRSGEMYVAVPIAIILRFLDNPETRAGRRGK